MRPSLTSIFLLAVAVACGDDQGQEEDVEGLCPEASWEPLRGDLDRSALAIWGSSDEDVVVVGGPVGTPGAALLSAWDGQAWRDIPTGTEKTLWWVWGAPGPTRDVWMVGDDGTILRWDGERVNELASGTNAHLYGVWGTSSTDVWIVGGRPGSEESPDDVVLHWDGSTLRAEEVPARGAALFKVWGAGDEIWATGEGGTILHRAGGQWLDRSVETGDTLVTVHGCSASEVYAVGGPHLYRWDGTSWGTVPEATFFASAAGVACAPSGVLVVGSGGLKLRLDRATGEWIDETLQRPNDADLHGAWISPGGAFWAAGGNYVAPPELIDRRTGVLAYRGCSAPR